MLSFLITAFMLVLLVTSYYIIIYDPELDPFRPHHDQHRKSALPNLIDRAFLYATRRLLSAVAQRLRIPTIMPSQNINKRSLENALNKVQRHRMSCSTLRVNINL